MMKTFIYGLFVCTHFYVGYTNTSHWSFDKDGGDNLPEHHRKYYTENSKQKYCRKRSSNDDVICNEQTNRHCWGYEKGCVPGQHFQYPACDQHKRVAGSLEEQRRTYWEQADFGYIKKKMDTMKYICKRKTKGKGGGFIKCNDRWEYCRAKYLVLDFTKKTFETNQRFNADFLGKGEIGAYCIVDEYLVKKHIQLNKELNSWKADLERFTELETNPFTEKDHCDVILDKPVVFMKLDAGVNLYHHFCDFFNLYASQHINGSFSQDVYIINWDTSYFPYGDLFQDVWRAFTKYPLQYIKDFAGKKVCIKDVVFSLPPRMMFGLYYNTPTMPSCRGSKLFTAFSEHVLHRLAIHLEPEKEDLIKVTLIRRSTKYRRILNAEELLEAMRKNENIVVRQVDFNRELPFLQQMQISHNSDVLIGIHGAGLTHMLFQPTWGAVFELYNTGDPECYRNLASFRGLSYFTWENKEKLTPEDEGHHPQLGAHEKFTNYSFDVNEFRRILQNAVKVVTEKRKHSLTSV